LNTHLKDGLSQLPLEFISVKHHKKQFERATCIISEFSGCFHLSGALTVNPYDIQDIACKIDEAISMTIQEKAQRMSVSFSHIDKTTIQSWAENFLIALKRCYDPVGSY